MYNELQKRKFVEAHLFDSESKKPDKLEELFINFFERLSKYESQYGKEFAKMSQSEVDEVLCEFLTGSTVYQSSSMSLLKKYLDWCIENGLSRYSENILRGKDLESIDISNYYRSSMVRDEEELEAILDEALKPEVEESADNLYRCYLHLVFAGLLPNQVIYLKESEVDLNARTIQVENNSIPVSNTLKRLLKNYLELESFARSIGRRNGAADHIRRDEIVRTGYLLENTTPLMEKAEADYRENVKKAWNVAISQKMCDASKKLKQTNILMSGIFTRMYAIEMETGEINCNEYFAMKASSLLAIQNPDKVVKQCLTEYKRWKKSFGL